jgi:hypothetical protein
VKVACQLNKATASIISGACGWCSASGKSARAPSSENAPPSPWYAGDVLHESLRIVAYFAAAALICLDPDHGATFSVGAQTEPNLSACR